MKGYERNIVQKIAHETDDIWRNVLDEIQKDDISEETLKLAFLDMELNFKNILEMIKNTMGE